MTTPSTPDLGAYRGEIRTAGWRRVSHGLFLQELEGLDERQEFLRDLGAWLLVLPPDARFTHLTGARVLGWDLPPLPEALPVFAATRSGVRGPRRPGLMCARLTRASEPFAGAPVPVDPPAEILLRAARDLGVVDLVVLLTSAIRLGHTTHEEVSSILEGRRPGTRRLRAALAMTRHETESAGETLLGLLHDTIGVAVEAQAGIVGTGGEFVARADFRVRGTRQLHEYDGAVHRTGPRHAADLRRDRRIAEAGYVRRGYVLADLTTNAAVTIHEIDRALGRAHQPSQLQRWRQLTDESLYSLPGRLRLMNRWRRVMGVVEWSRTA